MSSPVRILALSAKAASRTLATLSAATKNAVLEDLAEALLQNSDALVRANEHDLAAAQAAGLSPAKLARLSLTQATIAQLARGLRQVAGLPDPVGQVVQDRTVPSGLRVKRVRVPLGVIAMIYEARPAVTIDAFALCFKAGNACILKGGREASASNQALASVAHAVLAEHGLPAEALTLITGTDREDLKELLVQSDAIDLVIPRGAEPLIRFVHEHSRIPTIQHFKGVCHLYVHQSADLQQALEVVINAKVSSPATCNALECVLVDRAVAAEFLPALEQRCAKVGVEVRASERAHSWMPSAHRAAEEDFGHEFLDLILAVEIVEHVEQSIEHIARYGSGHTDGILAEDQDVVEQFVSRVGSSCVVVNASTRFNDGFQLGLGAEIGISTTRLHAYGPMGLEELTISRFVVHGDGHTR